MPLTMRLVAPNWAGALPSVAVISPIPRRAVQPLHIAPLPRPKMPARTLKVAARFDSGGRSPLLSLLTDQLAAYVLFSTRAPLVASILSSAALWSLGDVLAQRIERSLDPSQPKPYNVSRTMRQATIAATVFAPMAFLWYGSLNRVFPSSSLSHTFAKVALDQTAWAACMSYLLMAVSSLLEGKGLKAGLDKAGAEIWGVLKVNWCVWPLVQAINLSLVPVPLRILVMNVVAIPWTAFLAYKMNGSGGSRPPVLQDDRLK